MQTADADTQRIADSNGNPYAGDDGLRVRFEMSDVENQEKSKEAGYPVFDNVECVFIKAPGALDERVVVLRKEVTRAHYQRRFPRQYAAYRAGQQEPVDGMSLAVWPPLASSRGERELFAFHGVRTVEELAAVTDTNLPAFGMSGRKRRQQAQEWLAHLKSNAPAEKMRAALAERDNKIEVLMRAVETLQKQAGIAPAPVVEAPAAIEEAPKPRSHKKKEEN